MFWPKIISSNISRQPVFHRDIQTPRRELKIRRAAEYFWRNSGSADWNTISRVWYIKIINWLHWAWPIWVNRGWSRSILVWPKFSCRVFDISSQSKQKLRSKRRIKIVKIYANWDWVSTSPSRLWFPLFYLDELSMSWRDGGEEVHKFISNFRYCQVLPSKRKLFTLQIVDIKHCKTLIYEIKRNCVC